MTFVRIQYKEVDQLNIIICGVILLSVDDCNPLESSKFIEILSELYVVNI